MEEDQPSANVPVLGSTTREASISKPILCCPETRMAVPGQRFLQEVEPIRVPYLAAEMSIVLPLVSLRRVDVDSVAVN